MLSRFRSYYQLAKGRSAREVVIKGSRHLKTLLKAQTRVFGDLTRASYALDFPQSQKALEILRLFPTIDSDLLKREAPTIQALGALYLEHRFDLLGSGWQKLRHGMTVPGVRGVRYSSSVPRSKVNRANRPEALRIRALINDASYEAIPWQLDFKSGFSWEGASPSSSLLYGHLQGVDIKVPWELARMQHLPMLAWAYSLAKVGTLGFRPPEIYANEARNQILDFLAANPPRFGVNWRCTMDVGIRVANWLVTYDLFRAQGHEFDVAFQEVFVRSIHEHGRHCLSNLEYSPNLRSNHYLCDIAGLAFAGAFLPQSAESDVYLAFAAQELLSEMAHEFQADGSNFEASTCYHRLSTETMLYSALVIASLPPESRRRLTNYDVDRHRGRPPLVSPSLQKFDPAASTIFPAWFWQRLEKACEFTADVSKPFGEVIQVGDNDSGRFLKLFPKWRGMSLAAATSRYENLSAAGETGVDQFLDEDVLDQGHLLAAGHALFGRAEWQPKTTAEVVESTLCRGVRHALRVIDSALPIEGRNAAGHVRLGSRPEGVATTAVLLQRPNLAAGISAKAYPDFGLYLWRSDRLFLTLRCGSIGQNGNGGHAHNDQLSINLTWDGVDLLVDPGSYLYTPFPEQRRLFRSVLSHPTAWPAELGEQNDITGTFTMRQLWIPEVSWFDASGMAACLRYQQKTFDFVLKFEGDRILTSSPVREGGAVSNGYGKLLVQPS